MSTLGASPTVCPVAGVDGMPPSEASLISTFNGLRDELVSTLMYLLGNRDDAQDAAQEAFLKCWRARETMAKCRICGPGSSASV